MEVLEEGSLLKKKALEAGNLWKNPLSDPYDHLKPHCQKAANGHGFICLLCGKRGRDMYQMREHIEAAHEHLSPGYICQHCVQEFKNHNCLKVHMKKYH